MKQYRKDVIVYLQNSERRCFHVVAELMNKPGALANVAALVAGSSLNILSGFISVESTGEKGVWSFFVEDGHSKPEEVQALLMSSPFVTDVVVNEAKDGFVNDLVHFPLTLNTGERAMLVRQDAFSNMLAQIRETFGTGGDVIVYGQGRVMGGKAGEKFRNTLPEGFIRKNLDRLIALHSSLGWFKAELVRSDLESLSFTVRLTDNFECNGRRSAKPSGQFVRGTIGGYFGALFDCEFRCTETRCIATGDPYCEFTLVKAPLQEVPQVIQA